MVRQDGDATPHESDLVTVTLRRSQWRVIVGAARSYNARVPVEQGDGGECLRVIEEASGMSETPAPRESSGVHEGDRFQQMLPFGTDSLEVERVLEDGNVYVRRANGARQVFPASTLLETRYWMRVDD